MAGIYIHIPFCSSRCIYCAFYSTTALDLRQRYVDAICREVELRGEWRIDGGNLGGGLKVEGGGRIDSAQSLSSFNPPPSTLHQDTPSTLHQDTPSTLYLGGGTPSQLSIAQLRQIFDAIYKYNKVSPDAEVTIEVNPDDVTPEFAQGLRSLPVNRVSMGAQTFDDERLRWLRRRHTAQQVSQAVSRLRDVSIRNISIDLIYGFPDESIEAWSHDISQALALEPEHLSAYCLTIEEGTPLHQLSIDRSAQMDASLAKNCQLSIVNCQLSISEDLERRMYYHLIDRLEAAGYEHYEISNFARPGFRSRHNSSYWSQTPYIGIGAAAHSYDLSTRSWNVSDIRRYIDGMERGERIFDFETLDADTRYNDLVATALRTREGIDLDTLTPAYRDYIIKSARRYLSDGLLQLHGSRLSLTRRALFVSDMVMAELMKV